VLTGVMARGLGTCQYSTYPLSIRNKARAEHQINAIWTTVSENIKAQKDCYLKM